MYLSKAIAYPVRNLWGQVECFPQLRWDRADQGSYRLLTGSHFQSVLQDVINLEMSNDVHPDETVFITDD